MPSPLVVDEISRAEAVGPSVEKQQRSARNSRATRCLTGSQQDRRRGIVPARKQPSFSEQDRRVRRLEPRTPPTWCCRAEEKVTSQRNHHSKSAYRYFSAVREKRLAQQDRADRHTAEDPEMNKSGRDVCLLYEDDNDQSSYPCPSPLIDRGGDDLKI